MTRVLVELSTGVTLVPFINTLTQISIRHFCYGCINFPQCIFSLLSLFWKSKRRFMRSPCCVFPLNVPVFYTVHAISKESRRLVLPGTYFLFKIPVLAERKREKKSKKKMGKKKHVNSARNGMWMSRNRTFLFLWVTLPCCHCICKSKGPGSIQYFSL
jgi:hypothetical protein